MSVSPPFTDTNRDETLFDALYMAHSRVLYAFLLGQTGDRETAEDLLQETFVRVWQHLEAVLALPQERRRFWLFATARNLLRDLYRRRQVRAPYACALPEVERIDPQAEDPAERIISKETAAALDAAIRALPTDLRTVLTLHLLTGMTSAEIGKALARPAGTVRYQLSKARRTIAHAVGLHELSER
jgi:RNA polymerase sigma-70 factor (ECF subfamily)